MRKTKEKQEKILESSISIFLDKGFSKTKISDIAIKAGIGKGTVYEYFESKDNIFKECVKYILDTHMQHILRELDGLTDGVDKLQTFARIHYKYTTEHGNTLSNLSKECNEVVGNEIMQLMIKYRVMLIEKIEKILNEDLKIPKAHINQKFDSRKIALIFLGSINQYIIDKLLVEQECKEETLSDIVEFTQDLLNLIYGMSPLAI